MIKKTTKMQMYGDAVRRLADKIKRSRQDVMRWNAPDNAHFRDVVHDGGVVWGTLGAAIGESTLQGGKITGVALLWMVEYMTRAMGGLLVDNPLLRAGERGFGSVKVGKNKQGEDKKFQAFLKAHPNLASYVAYYMLCVSLIVGAGYGVDVKEKSQELLKTVKGWVDDVTTKDISIDDFVLDPNSDDEKWQEQINAIQPYVIAHLFLTEGFIETAYLDNGGKGTLTIGAGFTIEDKMHRNFASRVLGRPIGNGSSVTVQEARRLADAWMQEKIYPIIRSEFTAPMDVRTFITVAITAYNAGEYTFSGKNTGVSMRDAINQGKNKEEVANLLVKQYGKMRGTKWGGMANKYAVCASYLLGDISDAQVLNCISEAPYAIEPYVRADQQEYKDVYEANKNNMVRGRLVIYSGKSRKAKPTELVRLSNIADLLQKPKHRVTKGTVQLPVGDYLQMEEVARIQQGFVFNSIGLDYRKVAEQQIAESSEFSLSDKLNDEGEILFFDEKYEQAIKKFESALEVNPKNYIVYSNLSIAYYRNKDYKKGLQVVKDVLASKYFAEMPMNIKGYTYYNAALCCEKLGDKATEKNKTEEYYLMAKQYITKAKETSGHKHDVFVHRIDDKIKGIKSKKLAFNAAGESLPNKDGVLLYGKAFSGNQA